MIKGMMHRTGPGHRRRKRIPAQPPERFPARHADQAPAALERLQQVALAGDNIFAELMETVKCCSLGQITGALYEWGAVPRNM
jgi:methylmalonyl-CoA mutase N-terminal domain/subunit